MKNKREHIWERLSNNLTPCKLPLFVVFEVETSLFLFKLLLHDFFSCFSSKLLNFSFLSSIFWSLFPKIQQTKMLVACQRFGDWFLFGLVWQYSSIQKNIIKVTSGFNFKKTNFFARWRQLPQNSWNTFQIQITPLFRHP